MIQPSQPRSKIPITPNSMMKGRFEVPGQPAPESPAGSDPQTPSGNPTVVPRAAEPTGKATKSNRRRKLTFSAVALVLALALFAIAKPSSSVDLAISRENVVTEFVKRGRLDIVVTEFGTLESQKNVTLASQVEWKTNIISLVPEGTWVEKEEVLCELDSAKLQERLDEHEILLDVAEAQLEQARKDVAIQQAQNESDIAKAELNEKLAKLDVEKYTEGEFPQAKLKLDGEITLAKNDVGRSQELFDFTKRMSKKGYKSQADLGAAQLAVTKAKISLNVAEESRKVLEDFTHKRTIAALKANATESERQCDRVDRKAEAAMLQTKIRIASYERTAKSRRAYVERLQKNIAACTIRAPQPGEVVYANSGAKRRSTPKPIEVGAEVQFRQEIIKLPDLTKMKVDARVHESRISQVTEGLSVEIRVDAFPDEEYHGTVEHVSSVPLSGSWPNYDLKEYETVVHITSVNPENTDLRPGLTSEIRIQVEQNADVLQVPVQAVIGIGDDHYSYIVDEDGAERRKVLIGHSNDAAVEVVDGLQEGEEVVLNPRTQFADEISELTEIAEQEKRQNQTDPSATPLPQ